MAVPLAPLQQRGRINGLIADLASLTRGKAAQVRTYLTRLRRLSVHSAGGNAASRSNGDISEEVEDASSEGGCDLSGSMSVKLSCSWESLSSSGSVSSEGSESDGSSDEEQEDGNSWDKLVDWDVPAEPLERTDSFSTCNELPASVPQPVSCPVPSRFTSSVLGARAAALQQAQASCSSDGAGYRAALMRADSASSEDGCSIGRAPTLVSL